MKLWFLFLLIAFGQACVIPNDGVQIMGLNGTFYPLFDLAKYNESNDCFTIMTKIWNNWENISFIEFLPECNENSSLSVYPPNKINLSPPFEFGLVFFGASDNPKFHPIDNLEYLKFNLEYLKPQVTTFGIYPV